MVKVRVDERLPVPATDCGLKLAVTPVGNPEMAKEIGEFTPTAEAVNLSVPFAAEVTVTSVAVGVSEKPGTFTVRVSFCVTPPPVAVSVTG